MKKLERINEADETTAVNPLGNLTQLKGKVSELLTKIIQFASTEQGKSSLKSGDESADVVEIEENCKAVVTIKDLIATQNIVYVANTCKIAYKGSTGEKFDAPLYQGAKAGNWSKMDIWVAGKDKPTHIIDGHHRWSSVNMLNPETKVSGMIWVKVEPTVALAYLTAALRALDLPGQNQGAPSGNPTPVKGNCNPETIKAELLKVTKEVEGKSPLVDKFLSLYKTDFKVEGESLPKLAENLKNTESKIPDTAPKRELMPQLGYTAEDPNVGRKTIDALKSGEIDVKPPFTAVTAESRYIKTFEQFKRK